jgi:nicotinamide mononucleotide (NMN) deamidase PncC
VGTVWIGCATARGTRAEEHHFQGGRDSVRLQTVLAALKAMESALG